MEVTNLIFQCRRVTHQHRTNPRMRRPRQDLGVDIRIVLPRRNVGHGDDFRPNHISQPGQAHGLMTTVFAYFVRVCTIHRSTVIYPHPQGFDRAKPQLLEHDDEAKHGFDSVNGGDCFCIPRTQGYHGLKFGSSAEGDSSPRQTISKPRSATDRVIGPRRINMCMERFLS